MAQHAETQQRTLPGTVNGLNLTGLRALGRRLETAVAASGADRMVGRVEVGLWRLAPRLPIAAVKDGSAKALQRVGLTKVSGQIGTKLSRLAFQESVQGPQKVSSSLTWVGAGLLVGVLGGAFSSFLALAGFVVTAVELLPLRSRSRHFASASVACWLVMLMRSAVAAGWLESWAAMAAVPVLCLMLWWIGDGLAELAPRFAVQAPQLAQRMTRRSLQLSLLLFVLVFPLVFVGELCGGGLLFEAALPVLFLGGFAAILIALGASAFSLFNVRKQLQR
ncbi:MAG: hypothetical protein ACI9EF_002256 [Pseudohongiellaceae bacterium]|jgi:hypothetical protein